MAISLFRIIFLDKLWPDFNSSDLLKIVRQYKKSNEFWSNMISSNLKKRLNTSLFLFLIVILNFKYNFLLGFSLIVLGVLGIIEFLSILKKILKKKLFFYLLSLIFIIYIFTFCTLFFYFSNFYQLKILLFIILLGCIFSDIGGFIFGKLIQDSKN